MGIRLSGIISILVFYFAFFLVGTLATRRKRSNNPAMLLVAGRQIPLAFAVLTMTATWVGGGYINGTAEAVYDPQRGLVWAQAPWGYALSLIVGGLLFAAPMRRRGFTTLLDLFDRRYGKKTAAGLFVPALLGELFWSAAILAALGTTVGTVFGMDYSFAVVLSAMVAVAYTCFGGLWSVAYTDALQLFCIFIGLVGAIPFALEAVGGGGHILAGYIERFGESAAWMPPWNAWTGSGEWGFSGWLWTDMAFLLVFGGIPWQVYFQRVLSCRDEKTAVRFSVLAGVGCLIMAIPAVIIGVIGSAADWSQTGAGMPPEPALVLPWVLRYLTPPLVAVVGLGAVAAAVMSSVDSSFLSVASMFAWNVYRPLVRAGAGDIEIQRAIRISVVAAGLAASSLALAVGSVYTLWALCSDLVYVVLFPQLVTALFVKGVNRYGAVAGALVGFLLRVAGGEPYLGLPALVPMPMSGPDGVTMFPFRTFAMIAGLLTILMVSRLTRQSLPKQVR